MLKHFLTTIIISGLFIPAANAAKTTLVSENDILSIINHTHNLFVQNPKTPFSKWQLDQWAFTALTCAYGSNTVIPKWLSTYRPVATGSHSSMPVSICSELAKSGPNPHCFEFTSQIKPFQSIPKATGLYPTQGLFLEDNITPPKSNSSVMIGAKCLLSKDVWKSKQFYAGEAKILYDDRMYPVTVNTLSGSVKIMQASIRFKIDGLDNLSLPLNMYQQVK